MACGTRSLIHFGCKIKMLLFTRIVLLSPHTLPLPILFAKVCILFVKVKVEAIVTESRGVLASLDVDEVCVGVEHFIISVGCRLRRLLERYPGMLVDDACFHDDFVLLAILIHVLWCAL